MRTPMKVIHIPVDSLLKKAVTTYTNTSIHPFLNLEKHSLVKKLRNERHMYHLLVRLKKELAPYDAILKHKSGEPFPSNHDISLILNKFLGEIHERGLLGKSDVIPYILEHGFLDRLIQLFSIAYKEDPDLSQDDLIQALRHIYIMNILQLYSGKEPTLSPEVYAFGLLYPYEDNYLDDPLISNEEKRAFNDWLTLLLNGEKVSPSHLVESKLVDFVALIESQFDEDAAEMIYASLSLVHASQIKSLEQLNNNSMTKEEVMEISFLKGGSTLLADAYLIQSEPELTFLNFAFEMGTYLQLIDDLQDMKEDADKGIHTLFTLPQNGKMREAEIKQLLSYVLNVNEKKTSDTINQKRTKDFLNYGMRILIMDAVGQHPDAVSKSFYKELEAYSPVRLSFYKKMWRECINLLGLSGK